MGNLRRTIGWKTYGLFGLGNIIGAGIYVLIGEVTAKAGNGAIWSFAVAGIVAGFTAISYSALATRFPFSAGEVVYVLKGFNTRKLGLFIGLVLAFSGIVSGGALLNGFANYFSELFDFSRLIYIIIAVIVLAAVVIKGISETTKLAVAITVAETIGLLIIIGLSVFSPVFVLKVNELISTSLDVGVFSILLGSFLAFYAYIGFEDMVNLAEEVKNPEKNIKKGMFLAMAVAFILYILVAVASLAVVPASELGQSKAPLATVFQASTNTDIPLITIIGLFAIVNGILAQIVMSSRILYGLSREKLIASWFGVVNKTTKTPINSTVFVSILMLTSAISLPLGTLASMTSFGLLIIFSMVHASCLKLRKQLDVNPAVPVVGLVLNIGIIVLQIVEWM